MRLILDECLLKKLGRHLPGHDVTTVSKAGFAGVKNGELLKRIDGTVDAFITVDRNLPSRQTVSRYSFGVIIVRAASNRIEDLAPLAPGILAALETLQPGAVAVVE